MSAQACTHAQVQAPVQDPPTGWAGGAGQPRGEFPGRGCEQGAGPGWAGARVGRRVLVPGAGSSSGAPLRSGPAGDYYAPAAVSAR